jgi:hypothetical protein
MANRNHPLSSLEEVEPRDLLAKAKPHHQYSGNCTVVVGEPADDGRQNATVCYICHSFEEYLFDQFGVFLWGNTQ